MIVVTLDDGCRAFVAIAIRRYRDVLERNGKRAPAEALRLAHELFPEAGEPAVTDLDLLDIGRAARRLGISRRTLERRIADGTVRPVRIGRRVLFRPADLERLTRAG